MANRTPPLTIHQRREAIAKKTREALAKHEDLRELLTDKVNVELLEKEPFAAIEECARLREELVEQKGYYARLSCKYDELLELCRETPSTRKMLDGLVTMNEEGTRVFVGDVYVSRATTSYEDVEELQHDIQYAIAPYVGAKLRRERRKKRA